MSVFEIPAHRLGSKGGVWARLVKDSLRLELALGKKPPTGEWVRLPEYTDPDDKGGT